MDLRQLVENMVARGNFSRIVNNPLSQQGTEGRRYLGATLLPERQVPENAYTEENVRYRTVIANDSTRYSPVQLKQGALAGSVEVRLGEIDTGSEFTGQEFDTLVKLLNRGGTDRQISMQGATTLTRWANRALNLPLIEKMEKQRWEAIVDAKVVRTGDNNYYEEINYPNPTGHRVAAGGVWSNDAYDPMEDIDAMIDFLEGLGYTVNRIIAPKPVVNKLLGNAKMKDRNGQIVITGGVVTTVGGRLALADLNGILAEDGRPPIETYDLQYQTQLSSGFFLKRNVMVFVCTTGRDEELFRQGDESQPLIVPNTLGYQGVGRAAGQAAPGRVVRVEMFTNKPPRIEGEAWSTTLPVVLDPEAIGVITGIS